MQVSSVNSEVATAAYVFSYNLHLSSCHGNVSPILILPQRCSVYVSCHTPFPNIEGMSLPTAVPTTCNHSIIPSDWMGS